MIIPVNKAIEIVWIINKIPIDSGWFIKEKEKEEIIKKKNIKFWIISETENSLLKNINFGN